MSDLVRNVVKLVLCLLVAGALLLANIFVFLSDWTGLAAGLDLMGYEGQTVRRMPIVGALLATLPLIAWLVGRKRRAAHGQ